MRGCMICGQQVSDGVRGQNNLRPSLVLQPQLGM